MNTDTMRSFQAQNGHVQAFDSLQMHHAFGNSGPILLQQNQDTVNRPSNNHIFPASSINVQASRLEVSLQGFVHLHPQ